MKTQGTTLEMIAKKLRLSVATVSRALSNSPRVKASTKDKVLATAKELGYRPNIIAKRLKTGKTNTIGVIVPQIVPEFFAQILKGIQTTAQANGYQVLICSSEQRAEQEIENVQMLLSGIVDGILIGLTKETNNIEHLHNLKSSGIPFVMYDSVSDVIVTDKVIVNDKEGAYNAVHHLINNGCKKIGLISGPRSMKVYKERYKGFLAALSDRNIPFNEEWVFYCEHTNFEKDKIAIGKYLQSLTELPDAFFTGSDLYGIAAIKNLKAMGYSIPQQIQVIGFGNLEIGTIYEPHITTVAQPSHQLGITSTEMLITRINNQTTNNFSTIVMETKLLKRESTLKNTAHTIEIL